MRLALAAVLVVRRLTMGGLAIVRMVVRMRGSRVLALLRVRIVRRMPAIAFVRMFVAAMLMRILMFVSMLVLMPGVAALVLVARPFAPVTKLCGPQ
jgi:hypothetical protein